MNTIFNKIQDVFFLGEYYLIHHEGKYYLKHWTSNNNFLRNCSEFNINDYLKHAEQIELCNTKNNTFEHIQDSMDDNGYANFDFEAFERFGAEPCYISENSDNLNEIESYYSMLYETMVALKTYNFLESIAEAYDCLEAFERKFPSNDTKVLPYDDVDKFLRYHTQYNIFNYAHNVVTNFMTDVLNSDTSINFSTKLDELKNF